MEITKEVSRMIADESIREMIRVGIPVNEENTRLISAQINYFLSRNPGTVSLLLKDESVSQPPVKLGDRHSGNINSLMAAKNAYSAGIQAEHAAQNAEATRMRDEYLASGDYDPVAVTNWYNNQIAINQQREIDLWAAYTEQYNADIVSEKKRNLKEREAENKQKIIMAVVAVAIIAGGVALLAGGGTTAAGATAGTVSSLANKAADFKQSPLSIVDSVIPGAGESITNLTGKTPEEINTQLNNLVGDKTDEVVNRPPNDVPAPYIAPTLDELEKSAAAGNQASGSSMVQYVVIGGAVIVIGGGIMYFLNRKKNR